MTSVQERGQADDAELMTGVAAGDREGPLVTLYERYAGRIYGLGLRTLRDHGAAEELVQETFVRLWRSASRFDPAKGSFRTFIFMIARRAAVDFQRRSASRPLDTGVEDVPEGSTSTDPFEQIVLGLEVRDAMSNLSDNHREVLELHYGEDLTQRQIAQRLGAPLGTVKTRTYHALRALRLEFQERELVV